MLCCAQFQTSVHLDTTQLDCFALVHYQPHHLLSISISSVSLHLSVARFLSHMVPRWQHGSPPGLGEREKAQIRASYTVSTCSPACTKQKTSKPNQATTCSCCCAFLLPKGAVCGLEKHVWPFARSRRLDCLRAPAMRHHDKS